MACFTPLPALLCPPKDPFTPPTGAVVPVVYDTETEETRPLANGESFPGYQCVDAQIVEGEFPPTNQLLNMYKNLQERIKELERKYCECVCVDVECPPGVLKLENIPLYDCYWTAEEGDSNYRTPNPDRYVTLYYIPDALARLNEETGDSVIPSGAVMITSSWAAEDDLYIIYGDGQAIGNDVTFLTGSPDPLDGITPTIVGNFAQGVLTQEDFLAITHVTYGWQCGGA